MAMDHVDRQGWRFFNSGRDIVTTLGSMAKVVQAKDAAGLSEFLHFRITAEAAGTEPASSRLKKRTGRGFTISHPMAAPWDGTGRWRSGGQYLDSFESIEEAQPACPSAARSGTRGPDLVAKVRFELIGTPKGAPQSGIDRAYFRMKFDAFGRGA